MFARGKKPFWVIFLASVFVFVPLYQASAWSLFGITIGEESPNNETVKNQKNSQNMALTAAPLTHDLDQANKDTEGAEIVDGSALSAGLASDPASADGDNTTASDQISVYVVHEGDTLSQIAKMFNVSINTILLSNNLPKNGTVRVGQQLVILPVTGVQYTVKSKDTLAKIAAKFNVEASEIESFNNIEGPLAVGDTLIIPNGFETPAPAQNAVQKVITTTKKLSPSNGYFVRPVTGRITQSLHGHNAVDFGVHIGTPILAAAKGTVKITIMGGYNSGYGSYIVIDHPNGTQTLYAHLSGSVVYQGQQVSQGQIIGYSGNTGRSTGPHLHFEVHGGTNPF